MSKQRATGVRKITLLMVMTALCAASVLLIASASQGSTEAYKQDAGGLEKQFKPFVKAFHDGDAAGMEAAFKVFQFPDPTAWFGQYFKAEDVEQLGWDAEDETQREGKILAHMMKFVRPGGEYTVHCKRYVDDGSSSVKERQSSVRPVKPVPVEAFNIEFLEKSGKRFSLMGNFVYVDGAYRYVGGGALPLWLMPNANDPAKK